VGNYFQVQADEKYVVCNADEGDPGAFMDRSVLEVIRIGTGSNGICGYCIVPQRAYLYPGRISSGNRSVKNCYQPGTGICLLGENIWAQVFLSIIRFATEPVHLSAEKKRPSFTVWKGTGGTDHETSFSFC
jgi:NADH:ubiquinone oxidoreductase subunit F (NADH-binding)